MCLFCVIIICLSFILQPARYFHSIRPYPHLPHFLQHLHLQGWSRLIPRQKVSPSDRCHLHLSRIIGSATHLGFGK